MRCVSPPAPAAAFSSFRRIKLGAAVDRLRQTRQMQSAKALQEKDRPLMTRLAPKSPVHALEARGFLDAPLEPIGEMPGWNLGDLYAKGGAQLGSELDKAARDAGQFQQSYFGKLDGLARQNPPGLAEAIAAYEALSDRMGRI